jgi:hypothetical protein
MGGLTAKTPKIAKRSFLIVLVVWRLWGLGGF